MSRRWPREELEISAVPNDARNPHEERVHAATHSGLLGSLLGLVTGFPGPTRDRIVCVLGAELSIVQILACRKPLWTHRTPDVRPLTG